MKKKSAHLPSNNKLSAPLRQCLETTLELCTNCEVCHKQCAFLKKYGKPGQIARSLDFSRKKASLLAYHCSLCGLCTAVCPTGCDPARLFLEMRRQAHDQLGDLTRHRRLLQYEKRGNSPLFSWYGLPAGCDTVLFPGCNHPGTRPEITKDLFLHLNQSIPNLGVVLDCCTTPSHDLGRQEHFLTMFNEMREFLVLNHISRVITCCPNCHKVFSQYGRGLASEMVYSHLARTELPETPEVSGVAVVHDPCPLRKETGLHKDVRHILAKKGIGVRPMANEKENTLCCGEGGAVASCAPDLARDWTNKRVDQAKDRPIFAYCAGCVGFLGRKGDAHHVLDLVFQPEKTMEGKEQRARSPFTYWNRLKLKSWFMKNLPAAVTRERSFTPRKVK